MNSLNKNKKNIKHLLEFESREYFQLLIILQRNLKKIIFYSLVCTIITILISNNFIFKKYTKVTIPIRSPLFSEMINYYTLNELNIEGIPNIDSLLMFQTFIDELNNKKKNQEIIKSYINSMKINDSKKIEQYYNLSKNTSFFYINNKNIFSEINDKNITSEINPQDNRIYGGISIDTTHFYFNQNEITDFIIFFINKLNDNVKEKIISSIENYKIENNNYKEIEISSLNNKINNKLYNYKLSIEREVAALKNEAEIFLINESSILNELRKNPELYNKSNFNIDTENMFIGGHKSTLRKIEILEKQMKESDFEKFADIQGLQSRLYTIINNNDVALIDMAIKNTPLDKNYKGFKSIYYFEDDISIKSTTRLSIYELIFIFFPFFLLFFTIFFLSKDGYDRYANITEDSTLS